MSDPNLLPADEIQWIAFYNNSGEVVPPHAVMEITESEIINGSVLLYIDFAGELFGVPYAINGKYEVPIGGYGLCYRNAPGPQRYESGSPAFGEGWGPKPGQWGLAKGYPATTIVDGIVADVDQVMIGSFCDVNNALIRFTAKVVNNITTILYRVYAGTVGSEIDAGFTVVPWAMNRTGARAIGDWAMLHRVNNSWEIINLSSSPGYGIIEGAVAADFLKTSPLFLANVTHDDADNLVLGDQIRVWNMLDLADAGKYVFEGTRNSACQFRYSPVDEIYRVIWVACPADTPNVGGGEGSGDVVSQYSSGGLSSVEFEAFYGS